MNSRQYEKMMNEMLNKTLTEANITEYKTVFLSADRTQYEVSLRDGSKKNIPSGFEYLED